MKRWLSAVMIVALLLTAAICPSAHASGVATLPKGLKAVADETFLNDTSLSTVIVPESVTSIGKKAFANSSVSIIYLYDAISYIAPDAFEGCDDLIAYVNNGSYAEQYCDIHNIPSRPATIMDALTRYSCSMTPWTTMDNIFYRRVKNSDPPVQCVATLYDIQTGLSLRIRRVGAMKHADIEPMTTADTATLCKIQGVSKASEINSRQHWMRRPCLLILGNQLYACSLYGVPHDGSRPSNEILLDNGLNGYVMCLHFYGSTTSTGTSPDAAHQQAVRDAYAWWQTHCKQ